MHLTATLKKVVVFAVTAVSALTGTYSWTASHSDSPLAKQDPQVNITDVYAFIGTKYNDANIKVLNVVVHFRPFSEPGDGVIYDRFSDDARYSIHIAEPATGKELFRYDFEFSDVNPLVTPGLKNPNTILSYGLGTAAGAILSVGDAQQNFTQTYKVSRATKNNSTVIGQNLLTPPPNVGLRTTPAYNDPNTGLAVSGATTFAQLDTYTQQTIFGLPTGEVVFAGPREDGFYADTPGIFDLLDSRIVLPSPPGTFGQNGGGVDGFKGFNVLAFAIQIPVSSLPSLAYTDPFFGATTGVGVYATVSRPKTKIYRKNGEPLANGPYVQVNRMGNPLFNEVLVALKDKDKYNRTKPIDDSQFATYALNPEVAFLINFVFNLGLVETGRTDLAAVYIPDVLRVDTTTDPVKLSGQTGFSRLGFIGGDLTNGKSSGWPNGRRFGDDVVDIALTAVASGPTYSTITLVGDNIETNDQVYHQTFPYSATPHSGARNSKDSGVNDN